MISLIQGIGTFVLGAVGMLVIIPLVYHVIDFWVADWDMVHNRHCSHCPKEKV